MASKAAREHRCRGGRPVVQMTFGSILVATLGYTSSAIYWLLGLFFVALMLKHVGEKSSKDTIVAAAILAIVFATAGLVLAVWTRWVLA